MSAARAVLAFSACMLLAPAGCMPAHGADARGSAAEDRVVYHINDADAQATRAMQYIANHLEVNPKARIVVVTHAAGVDFLVRGARTKAGNPYGDMLETLLLQGVRFAICEITLRERQMTRKQFIPEASYVPSGVAEIARLQQREGYAYLRP